jgi:hypothetical protein
MERRKMEWLTDVIAGMSLVGFVVCAFALAGIAQAALG